METIAERIGLCEHCLTDETRYCHSDCHYYSKYIGATEQKAIDINKAIKAHCSFCEAHNACVDRGGFCCPETEHIKKTMED